METGNAQNKQASQTSQTVSFRFNERPYFNIYGAKHSVSTSGFGEHLHACTSGSQVRTGSCKEDMLFQNTGGTAEFHKRPAAFQPFIYLFVKKRLLVMPLPPNEVCPTSLHSDTPLSSANFQPRPKKAESPKKASRTVSMLTISCWAAHTPHSRYVCLEGSRVDMPTRTSERNSNSL